MTFTGDRLFLLTTVDAMQEFLDWFQLSEFFPLGMLIFLLAFVGQQIAPKSGDAQKRAKVVFVIGFGTYACMDLSTNGILDVTETMYMVMRAILAGGIAYGLGSIGFSLVAVIQDYWESLPQDKPIPTVFEPRIIEPEVVSHPSPEPPPPPPTQDERAEDARRQYQHRLELIERANLGSLETKAAQEKAKQAYLHAIDGVIS